MTVQNSMNEMAQCDMSRTALGAYTLVCQALQPPYDSHIAMLDLFVQL